jgi:hypothetical protein
MSMINIDYTYFLNEQKTPAPSVVARDERINSRGTTLVDEDPAWMPAHLSLVTRGNALHADLAQIRACDKTVLPGSSKASSSFRVNRLAPFADSLDNA